MQDKTSGVDGLQQHSETKTGDAVSLKRLLALVQSQGHKCSLTGINLTPDVANADHVHSLMDGGQNSMQNLQIVHQVVNRMKGTMSQGEFIMWCKRVAAHDMGM